MLNSRKYLALSFPKSLFLRYYFYEPTQERSLGHYVSHSSEVPWSFSFTRYTVFNGPIYHAHVCLDIERKAWQEQSKHARRLRNRIAANETSTSCQGKSLNPKPRCNGPAFRIIVARSARPSRSPRQENRRAPRTRAATLPWESLISNRAVACLGFRYYSFAKSLWCCRVSEKNHVWESSTPSELMLDVGCAAGRTLISVCQARLARDGSSAYIRQYW